MHVISSRLIQFQCVFIKRSNLKKIEIINVLGLVFFKMHMYLIIVEAIAIFFAFVRLSYIFHGLEIDLANEDR